MRDALAVWRWLTEASDELDAGELKGRGCRIHISGGEPFGRWRRLIEICRRVHAEGLPPPDKIETNAFWSKDEEIVRRRIGALSEAGMKKLVISADPYHQQYVPIERCRLAAKVAGEMLGADRVQVRWRDWLQDGFDTGAMANPTRMEMFVQYALGGRDRFNGRAAEIIAPQMPQKKTPDQFTDSNCRQALLRSRHVHVGPGGWVTPGTCAGIVLGKLPLDAHLQNPGAQVNEVSELWNTLWREHSGPHASGGRMSRPILDTLAEKGPAQLAELARGEGFRPGDSYASKCHLCWDVRKWLYRHGRHRVELGPEEIYRPAPVKKRTV